MTTLLLGTVGACLDADPGPGVEDGVDETFASGKADTGGIIEGELKARAVLRYVNTATRAQLVAIGLTARVAEVLEAVREGDDATLGTDDDGVFDTLEELDAVPFVGASVLATLVPAALDALPAAPAATSCENPTWETTTGPQGARAELFASERELYLVDNARVLRGAADEWTPVPDSTGRASRGMAADVLGIYALRSDAFTGSLRAPNLDFSSNWTGRWTTERVITDDMMCAKAPFLCDSDPDYWRVEVTQARLDDRGFLHAAVVATTDDGSSNRALLYVTNRSGAWQLHQVAIGRWTGSAASGWTTGTPDTRSVRICTGASGAAVVFPQFRVVSGLLAVATPAGNTMQVQHYDVPVDGWDPAFGSEARQLDCDSAGDQLHIVYESGHRGDVITGTVYDLAQRAFVRQAEAIGVGWIGLHFEPMIRIDERRDRVHIVAQGVDAGDYHFFHASGTIDGGVTMIEKIPVFGAGVVSSYTSDMEVDPAGAVYIAKSAAFDAPKIYAQRCQ